MVQSVDESPIPQLGHKPTSFHKLFYLGAPFLQIAGFGGRNCSWPASREWWRFLQEHHGDLEKDWVSQPRVRSSPASHIYLNAALRNMAFPNFSDPAPSNPKPEKIGQFLGEAVASDRSGIVTSILIRRPIAAAACGEQGCRKMQKFRRSMVFYLGGSDGGWGCETHRNWAMNLSCKPFPMPFWGFPLFNNVSNRDDEAYQPTVYSSYGFCWQTVGLSSQFIAL